MALSRTESIALSLILSPPSRTLDASEKKYISDAAALHGMSVEQYKSYAMANYEIPTPGGAPALKASGEATPTPTTPTPTPTTPTSTTPTPTAGVTPETTTAGVKQYTGIGTTKRIVVEASSLEEARSLIMKQGMITSDIREGDWVTYPDTGYSPEAEEIEPDRLSIYKDYLAWQKDNPWMPIPKNELDYVNNAYQWLEWEPYFRIGYTREQMDDFARGYTEVEAYGKKYGDLEDQYPQNFGDYIENSDIYQQQLTKWKKEAGSEAVGFTDAQIREWQDYTWHSRYRESGDVFFADMGDFFNNYDEAIQQLSIWRKRAGEAEVEQKEGEEYTKWARERTKYAAEEAYTEAPMYKETFSSWLPKQASAMSGALTSYVESQYPSLQARYEAGLPRLTGYPTREEARAEAARREAGFKGWLTGQTPGIYQEYMGQRPTERGERLYMYAPAIREVGW